jgi:hypothetical protein
MVLIMMIIIVLRLWRLSIKLILQQFITQKRLLCNFKSARTLMSRKQKEDLKASRYE